MAAAAAAPSKQKKPQPPRHDPAPRHIDGTSPWMKLKNTRPDRVYRAADKVDRMFGLPFYLARGWKQETYTGEPGGLCFAGGQTCQKGDPLESMGHVIVSIERERWEELELYGDDGNSGQAEADRIEDAIIDKKKGMADLLRGIGGPNYFRAANGTRAPELEQPGAVSNDDPFGS